MHLLKLRRVAGGGGWGAVGLGTKAHVSPGPGRCRSSSQESLLFCQVLQLTDIPTASWEGNVMSSYPQEATRLGEARPSPGLTACTCLSRGQIPAPRICRAPALTYLHPPSPGPTGLYMCFSRFGHWPAAGHLQSRLGRDAES